jgi:hypothetical protein
MKTGHGHSPVRWLCLSVLGLVLIFFSMPETQARMGGGHSFSGGSSSGGSGSSSGSGGGSWGGGSSSGSSGGSWGGSHWGGSASPGYANRSGMANTSGYISQSAAATDRSTLLIEIVFLILVIYVLLRLLNQGSFSGNTNTVRSRPLHDLTVMNASLDDQLQKMKTHDANFSKVVFIDFACLIYH